MELRFAKILSFIFHPLLIPMYVFVTILELDEIFSVVLPWPVQLLLAGSIAMTTCIMPAIIIFLMYRVRLISSLYIPVKEERLFPLIILAIFYFLTFYLMKRIYLPQSFLLFLLGASGLAIVSSIVNLFIKISLHMIAAGAVTGFMLGLCAEARQVFLIPLLASLLVSGCTGFGRLVAGTHRPPEIYLGWIIGALGMWLMVVFS